MAVNRYFNYLNSLNERKLYNDLIVENIKCSGVDVYYIPREDFSVDPILGESFQTRFKKAYVIEMYYNNVMGPEGTGDIMSKFGLQVQDEFKFMVARSQFEALEIPGHIRPREGDIVYVGEGYGSFSNSYFEITFVEPDRHHYPFGAILIYEIQAKTFTYSNEKFETGTFIDQISVENTNEIELSFAVNQGIKDRESTLLSFDEKNPFGDL